MNWHKAYLVVFIALSCLNMNLGKYILINLCSKIMVNIQLVFLFPITALKCHCDICTAETNHTCETDGFCFTSTSLSRKTGALVHAYRYIILCWKISVMD